MRYWLITSTDKEPYMFKKTYSVVIAAKNPEAAGAIHNEKYYDYAITKVEEVPMNRSLAQAYTHKVTLKQDILGEKKGNEYVLFDDGKVFDSEIMAFRVPPKAVVALVQNWEAFPMLVSAVKNDKYHQHEYKDKVISVCECGDVEQS